MTTRKPLKINNLSSNSYGFYTGFQQKMWKSILSPFISKSCAVLLCLILLVSCSLIKKTTGKEPMAKVQPPSVESTVMSMSEEEVRKKLGDPTTVSLTTENHILWTYAPDWKLLPDNKDTVYVEFENGKVIKVTKAKK